MELFKLRDRLLGAGAVAVGLVLALVPFSLLIGWNLATVFMFWFLVVPVLALYLPAVATGGKGHVMAPLLGLAIFYAVMVWMVYSHYETDYFRIMAASFVVNIVTVTVAHLGRRGLLKTTNRTGRP